jgi:hypothetical protein
MKKIFMLCVILITCSSCSQLSLLASGTSLAISQNSYAKIYNAADVLTIMSTDESIKKHAYKNIKKVKALKDIERRRQILLADLEQLKKGKEYIYDKTWGLTD